MRVKLRELRAALGYNQTTFAQAVGISRTHYCQIESGEKDPSLKVSLRIKKQVGYNGDDIFLDRKCPK